MRSDPLGCLNTSMSSFGFSISSCHAVAFRREVGVGNDAVPLGPAVVGPGISTTAAAERRDQLGVDFDGFRDERAW